jgi:hypothetical protein
MCPKVPIVKARRAAQLVLSLAILAGAASCLDISSTGVGSSQIRIVNASGQQLDIFLDNALAIDASQQLNVSLISVTSGIHELSVRTAAGVETPLELTTTPGGFTNTYVYTNSSGVVNLVLLDTTDVPTGNTGRVRALNLSRLAGSIDVYSNDAVTTTKLAPTFDYLSTTPYAPETPGGWEVYITPAGSTTKLHSTGVFQANPGDRLTVVLIDSLSVPVFRILPN